MAPQAEAKPWPGRPGRSLLPSQVPATARCRLSRPLAWPRRSQLRAPQHRRRAGHAANGASSIAHVVRARRFEARRIRSGSRRARDRLRWGARPALATHSADRRTLPSRRRSGPAPWMPRSPARPTWYRPIPSPASSLRASRRSVKVDARRGPCRRLPHGDALTSSTSDVRPASSHSSTEPSSWSACSTDRWTITRINSAVSGSRSTKTHEDAIAIRRTRHDRDDLGVHVDGMAVDVEQELHALAFFQRERAEEPRSAHGDAFDLDLDPRVGSR